MEGIGTWRFSIAKVDTGLGGDSVTDRRMDVQTSGQPSVF